MSLRADAELRGILFCGWCGLGWDDHVSEESLGGLCIRRQLAPEGSQAPYCSYDGWWLNRAHKAACRGPQVVQVTNLEVVRADGSRMLVAKTATVRVNPVSSLAAPVRPVRRQEGMPLGTKNLPRRRLP